jgi:hypothetical protein
VERIRVAPLWLYQRYRSFWDRLVPALGMALLFVLTDQATGAFSREWRLFIASGLLVVGLVTPTAGYVLFVLALAYPLYSISIYVAALALSVLVLLGFFLTRHLTAVVLVLVIPLLVPYRIAPLVPLLAGLCWAEWGGALAGLGSALWLKTVAGLCGATPDLTQLGGQPLALHQLIPRFQGANSLQTLLLLAQPWLGTPPDPETLLFHILEVLGWGLAGYGVGLMCQRTEGMPRPAVGLLASVSAGLLGMWLVSLVVPVVLGLREASAFPFPFMMECCWSGVIGMVLYAVSRYLTRPAVVPLRSRDLAGLSQTIESSYPPVRPATEPAPRPWGHPQPRDDEQTDIIMIDLD